MSASTAGCMLDYVSNSTQAIALKGFWLCCHVNLAPVTFDSRASTKGKKKLVLNKSLCSKRCIVFVSTGFHYGSMVYRIAHSGVHTSLSQLKRKGLGSLCFTFSCLVMKALYLVLVIPWVSRFIDRHGE